jgi:uncharacterized protein involved in exopolysaccharide biosynthesis
MQRLTAGNPMEGTTAAFQRPVWEPLPGGPAVRINALDSLRRHRMLAISVAVISFSLAMVYLYFKYTKTYVAESILFVSPTYPATLADDKDKEAERPYEDFIDQQVHAVTRHDILVSALRSLPAGDWRMLGENENAAADYLANALKVARVETTYQVSIDLTSNHPQHLSEIVNAVAKAYVATAKSEEFYGRDSRLAGLNDEHDKLEQQLTSDMTEQAGLLKTLGLATIDTIPGVGNPYNEHVTKMRTDLETAREQRETAEAQLGALSSKSGGDSALQAEAEQLIAADPGLNSLRTSMNVRRAQLNSDIAGMTDQNPVRTQDEYEMAEIDSQMADMEGSLEKKAYQQLQAKYRAQLNSARAVETSLMKDLSNETTDTTSTTPKFQRASELSVDIGQIQTRLSTLNDRISTLELESSSPGSVHVFSTSVEPSHPDSSKLHTLILVLIPACLLLGLIAAIARDIFFDNTIFTADDIERCIGVPPVGMVFDQNNVSQGMLDACLMRVAASVDSALQRSGVRTFALTSVKSHGGTSSLTVGLAEELARMGRRVLVLNAEGGSLAHGWYPPGEDGRVREFTPDPTTLPGWSGSPSNPRPPSVQTVVSAFASDPGDYDILLLDCAPLLLSATTEYFVRMCEVTLLIVESGHLHKQDLYRAGRLLERLSVPGLAVVLNKLSIDRADPRLREDIREFEHRRRMAA